MQMEPVAASVVDMASTVSPVEGPTGDAAFRREAD